jgi:hypothetical protein
VNSSVLPDPTVTAQVRAIMSGTVDDLEKAAGAL